MFVVATILFVLTAFIGLFLAIIHPLLAIFDCATSRQLSGTAKAAWIVVTLFFGALGSMAYGFLGGSSPWFRRTSWYSLLLAIGGILLTVLAVSQSPEIKQNFLVAMGEGEEISADTEQTVASGELILGEETSIELGEDEEFPADESSQPMGGFNEVLAEVEPTSAGSQFVSDSSASDLAIKEEMPTEEEIPTEHGIVSEKELAVEVDLAAQEDLATHEDSATEETEQSFAQWLGQAASALAGNNALAGHNANLPAAAAQQPPVESKPVLAKTNANKLAPTTFDAEASPSDRSDANQAARGKPINRYTSSPLPVETSATQSKVINRYREIYPAMPTAVESSVRNRYTGQ